VSLGGVGGAGPCAGTGAVRFAKGSSSSKNADGESRPATVELLLPPLLGPASGIAGGAVEGTILAPFASQSAASVL
jgi:hypothetical protein